MIIEGPNGTEHILVKANGYARDGTAGWIFQDEKNKEIAHFSLAKTLAIIEQEHIEQ